MTGCSLTRRRCADDVGSALIIVLLIVALLAALGIGLVDLSNTERAIATTYRSGYTSHYAAEAALERALLDLRPLTDWNGVLSGLTASTFVDASLTPSLPWGGQLDLLAATAAVQAASDAAASWGSDNPTWRLYASGPLSGLVGMTGVSGRPPLPYLIVWVADDRTEADGNPSVDSNGVIGVIARAVGPGPSRQSIEATVEKPVAGAPGLRVLSWRVSR